VPPAVVICFSICYLSGDSRSLLPDCNSCSFGVQDQLAGGSDAFPRVPSELVFLEDAFPQGPETSDALVLAAEGSDGEYDSGTTPRPECGRRRSLRMRRASTFRSEPSSRSDGDDENDKVSSLLSSPRPPSLPSPFFPTPFSRSPFCPPSLPPLLPSLPPPPLLLPVPLPPSAHSSHHHARVSGSTLLAVEMSQVVTWVICSAGLFSRDRF
jgi:hypothetical protein